MVGPAVNEIAILKNLPAAALKTLPFPQKLTNGHDSVECYFTRLEELSRNKYCSLLDLLISYGITDVLRIRLVSNLKNPELMWGLSSLRLPPDLLSRWEDLVRAGVKDKKKTFFFVTNT